MLSSKTGLVVKAMVAAGICLGSTSAIAAPVRPNTVLTSAMTMSANPCPVGMQGCVLPLQEPVAVAQPQTAPAPQAYVPPPAASGGGFGLLPILAGLGLLGGLAFLLLDDDGAVSA
jgi:hypothetical protein